MEDIPMFCDNNPDCRCNDICCQACPKRPGCENKCSNVRYKEKIYSSPAFLIEQLVKLAEREDNWLIAVAAEKIRELTFERGGAGLA
jgi:hypothetical protein